MSQPTGARAEVLRTRDFVGWTVSDPRGNKVGSIDDILIDRGGKVRFLSLNPGLFKKRVLLPVDGVSWGDGALVLSDWTEEQVKALPPYDPDVPLSADVLEEMERAFPRFYGPRGASAPATSLEAQIVPLSQAKGFRLSGGSPDLTGWHVFGGDGERAGTVAGMLVDPVAMTVRYLAVRLADDLFRLNDERMVVVPTERVDLRERGNDVWVNGLSAQDLSRLPAYTGGPLDPLIVSRVDEAFAHPREFPASGAGSTATAEAGAANTPVFGGDPRASGDDHLLPGEVPVDPTRATPAELARREEERMAAEARRDDAGLDLRPMDRGPGTVSDAPVAPALPADALPPVDQPLPDRRGDLPGA
jgi:sporulation protein YlmC with PRC-barrel domain